MNTLSAMLYAFTGFAALCMAMSRHQQAACGRRLDLRVGRALRVGGGSLLLLAYLAAVRDGWGAGSVAWFGDLSVAAIAVVLLLLYRSRWLPKAALASLFAGTLVLAWAYT